MWEKIFDNLSDDNHVYLFVFEQEVPMQSLASLSVLVFFFFPQQKSVATSLVGSEQKFKQMKALLI